MIDRVIEKDGWADNWVGYWQDALAENPTFSTQPEQHRPFSILDPRCLERQQTDGSFRHRIDHDARKHLGRGSAGFGEASQNDAPMAAKARIIGTAFLGVEMKSPAATMLPITKAPKETFRDGGHARAQVDSSAQDQQRTSRFFRARRKGRTRIPHSVTLRAGTTVKPNWPFDELGANLPEQVVSDLKDTRERLAARISSSRRFAEVMANRLWKRLMGAGLVEKVDDWEGKTPSDPLLLAYLTDELIRSGYDFKALTRLIMNSKAYQRRAIDLPENLVESDRFFEGPYRRRMTAEQVVDNAWQVSGKKWISAFSPWTWKDAIVRLLHEFRSSRTGMAIHHPCQRAGPASLAMPKMQAVVDALLAFGWRNSRPEPTSHRIEEPNPFNPECSPTGSWVVG